MLDSRDLELVAAVARFGSLARAARWLDLTVAAVSKRLAAFEGRLGVRLFDRTTRRVTPTPEGELIIAEARAILDRMGDVEALIAHRRRAPAGHLRVNSSLGYGRRVLAPLLSAFARRHADVTLELTLTQGLPIAAELPFDVAVRLGEPDSPALKARKLADNVRVLAAAPRYLRNAGTPRSPRELVQHRCLVVREGEGETSAWVLRGPNGIETVRVHPALASNDGESVVAWACEGHGIVLRSQWDVGPLIAQGRLTRVLAEFESPAHVYALWPDARFTPARVTALVEFLAARLGAVTPSARV